MGRGKKRRITTAYKCSSFWIALCCANHWRLACQSDCAYSTVFSLCVCLCKVLLFIAQSKPLSPVCYVYKQSWIWLCYCMNSLKKYTPPCACILVCIGCRKMILNVLNGSVFWHLIIRHMHVDWHGDMVDDSQYCMCVFACSANI